MNPMRIRSPLVTLLMESDSYNILALAERDASEAQKNYNGTSQAEAILIRRIIETGDLPVMIAAEFRLQRNDLEKYAKTPEEVENVRVGLENFQNGLNQYDLLLEQPNTYRKAALSYFGAQRDKELDVPLDGIRRAISSQLSRLRNRQALTATTEERDLLSARRSLLSAIRREYAEKQKDVCCENNREPDRGDERGLSR